MLFNQEIKSRGVQCLHHTATSTNVYIQSQSQRYNIPFISVCIVMSWHQYKTYNGGNRIAKINKYGGRSLHLINNFLL